MGATRSHRPVSADIGGKKGFAGLSDRAVPVQLSRIESPDLINCEFSGRLLEKRNGYRRLHTNRLRNASVYLDGTKDYYSVGNITAYRQSGTLGLYAACGVMMQSLPTVTKFLVGIGHQGGGVGANQAWAILFDPSLGAGVGGFAAVMFDAALRTVTITDATAVGEFRMVEAYTDVSVGGALRLTVWKEDGTSTTAISAAPGASILTSTEPLLIGAGQSASLTVDTTTLPNASICEVRYKVGEIGDGSLAACKITTTNRWYIREIEDTNISLFTGYWKANDGNTAGILRDAAASENHAVPPEEAVAWTSDTALVAGTSGLKFHGKNSWIHIKDSSTNGTALSSVFIPTTGNYGNFTFRCLYVPQLPVGASVMPDSCLLWAGHDSGTPNLPQPIGLSIVSDQLVGSFNDNGTLRTARITSVAMSALNGKKLRIAFFRSGAGGVLNQILLVMAHLNANGTMTQYISAATACTGTAAGAVSANWSMMQHMSAFTQQAGTGGVGGIFGTPYTTALSIRGEVAHPHGLGIGVLDHCQLIWCNATGNAANVGLGAATTLGVQAIVQEIANWQAFFPACTTVFDIPMNEGSGNFLGVTSANSQGGISATLHPQLGRSVRWDRGLVDPYRDPPGQTIIPYDRFRGDGTRLKETLIVSGSTLYRLDEETEKAIPIAAGIFQGGQWSDARQGHDLLLACPNGRRPLRWNGSTLDLLGIEAPLNPVQITTKAGGGSFTPGSTYSFYVTFRNSSSPFGDESNPSPVETVTFSSASGHNTIDAVNLPVSADPQVNQRRLWMVPAPGTAGAQAYLLLTVNDNVTTQWTQDITVPVATGTVMEYLSNKEAPQGSVIATHKDFTYVGGNQVFPTRFFRSVAGNPSRWRHNETSGFWVDLDLDSGDPIVAAKRLVNNLFVSLGDGWARVFATGNTLAPVAFAFTRRDHGAVGPAALCLADDLMFYLSERDVYASNGFDEANVSSPEEDPKQKTPSIQETMLSGLNDARRQYASMAYHRSKKQVWIACTSATAADAGRQDFADENDLILVYDTDQRKWSKYDIPASTLREVDDATTDQARMYGIVRGFVCRMDEPDWYDGTETTVIGIATSGSTTGFAVAGTPYSGLDLRGLTAHVYKVQTRTLYTATVYNNTSNTVTFYDPIGATIAAGDQIAMGGYRWFADFVVDFGDPITEKRLKLLRLVGSSSSDLQYLVVTIKATNNIERTWSQDGARKIVSKWPVGASKKAFSVGGRGTSFRIRIQDSTIPDPRPEQCPPNLFGKFALSAIILDAEELGHVV